MSELAPPEPMTIILSHLAQLSSHECLQVKHRRQPFPLYDKLNSAGFAYHCKVHGAENITLYIYHASAQHAFESLLADEIENSE